MKLLLLAWKRSISPLLLLLLSVLVLLPPLCAAAGRETKAPPAGYVCSAEKNDDIARLCRELEAMGFQPVSEASALRTAIAEGMVDCGVIIPESAPQAIPAHELDRLLLWVDSPSSQFSALYRASAAAALFSVTAPYYTADALAQSGISEDEVLAAYYAAMDGDMAFRFEISSTSGAFYAGEERSARYLTGAMSMLVFIALFFGAALPLTDETQRISRRIGMAAARRSILLPGSAVRCGLILLAAALGCLLGNAGALLLPVILYAVLVYSVSIFIAMLPGKGRKITFASLLCMLSLAVCPVFIDLSLFVPGIAFLRCLAPPAWLWLIKQAESPAIAALAAALSLCLLGLIMKKAEH